MKTQKWLSPYADNVIGKFNTMKEDAISRGEEVDDSALFLEACGGKNKQGKVFGMGSELCKYTKSTEVEEVDHLKERLKSLESEVNLVHELVEENRHLKNEMAELRSLVRKLAGNKSGNSSSGPSHIPSINDDRDVCEMMKLIVLVRTVMVVIIVMVLGMMVSRIRVVLVLDFRLMEAFDIYFGSYERL